MSGAVLVDERPVTKPGVEVPEDATVRVRGAESAWVSRGGEKLAAALDAFGIEPRDRLALDVGASTGGFTDVLLARGAPRVVVLDRTNARALTADRLPEPPELVTIDVSFISLRTVLPAVVAVTAPGTSIVALVKPQFEVGRGRVGKG